MDTSTAPKYKASWWYWLLIIMISVAFGYAGIIKLINVHDFSHVIARFDVLWAPLINPTAIILPVLELLLGLGLWVPSRRKSCLLGVLLCCLAFAVVLLAAILRGIPVTCGCFGFSEKPSLHTAWWALGRDILLIAMAAFLYLRAPHKSSP